MKIRLGGVLDLSTLDYPKKLSSVVYLHGCSFKCPFCHNPELVIGTECKEIEAESLADILKQNFLVNSVVITGGEPLLQDSTVELIKLLKQKTKFLIKIDTNGSFPENLKKVLSYVDYVAVDIKAPFDKYEKLIGVENSDILKNVKKSLDILSNSEKMKEARTTIVPGMNDSYTDIEKISQIVKEYGFNRFVIQQFRPMKTLDKRLESLTPSSYEHIKELGETAKKILKTIDVLIVTSKNGFEKI